MILEFLDHINWAAVGASLLTALAIGLESSSVLVLTRPRPLHLDWSLDNRGGGRP
jgi:hypothetical protein